MENKIKKAVSRLYQDTQHRRIIDLIIKHRPTVKAVLEQVAASIRAQLKSGVLKTNFEFSHDFWPEKDEITPEMRLWPAGWNKGQFSICYMLRSKTRTPFIGDSFTVLVNAWCANDAARRKIQEISSKLPSRAFHNHKRWADWEVLWEGETHRLQDLAEIDAERLSTLLSDTIRKTIEPIHKAMEVHT